ncbi:DNA-3-methyladenine glycosylase I [Inquilinus ginsengisoli]|uniref:DNA-3-methyladenine glycosylase I n=1 Tax=Inquilinus ginsengisoli TaxID=363840 RepID=A0ABU1JUM1_9PROT|nr:DNA-3-methyladenine glycosylase I [Inquilinus ginsengisoli]MDR6292318.1 DNA-3-methyladenine glycosylase I [Inquilinus ginsengisoli]
MAPDDPKTIADGITIGPDGVPRCSWHFDMPDHPDYHDREWGRPVEDDQRLFEKICLEGFQSGLSWLTILRKRESFREAFADFEIERVAGFTETDVERLLGNPGIIRNRAKILSTINNARRARELIQEAGSLGGWLWAFEPGPEERPRVMDLQYWRSNPTSPASERLSKALKTRGWTFVGPTTIYAFMQAMGLVNDHLEGCACRPRIEEARQAFARPAKRPSVNATGTAI